MQLKKTEPLISTWNYFLDTMGFSYVGQYHSFSILPF